MTWYSPYFSIPLNIESGKITNKKLNKIKNDFVMQNEVIRNITDALDLRYDIIGLPETCSKRVVLQSLLFYGYVFFFEKQNNLLALPGMPDGSGINVYADFAGAYVYGANGYNERINLYIPGSDESAFLQRTIEGNRSGTSGGVMVRENKMLYPFINQCMYYAERQADTLRKIETAEKNAAAPYIITAEESIINTVKSFMQHRDNNEEYIISSGIFPADKIKLLPFDISADAIRVMTSTYDWYCSHFRELCGVKASTNIDKKGENLIQDEVNINDDYTAGQIDKVIAELNIGFDTVNKMFGVNISAKRKEVDNGSDNDLRGDAIGGQGDVSGDGGQRPATDD